MLPKPLPLGLGLSKALVLPLGLLGLVEEGLRCKVLRCDERLFSSGFSFSGLLSREELPWCSAIW